MSKYSVTSIPTSISLVHFIPRCTASDFIQLSNTSQTVLAYLREVGAFKYFYQRDLESVNNDGKSVTLDSHICEKRLRRAVPSFQWLSAGLGCMASNSASTFDGNPYHLSSIGGIPSNPSQSLPIHDRQQHFFQVDSAGKRLVGLVGNDPTAIALWMRKTDKNNPRRVTFTSLSACSGCKSGSKKKKKSNSSNGSRNSKAVYAVTVCKSNPDLIAAVYGGGSKGPALVCSLHIFDLCEDLNMPVSTTNFVSQDCSSVLSTHSTTVVFVAKSKRICVRQNFQFHIFSSDDGSLLTTIGKKLPKYNSKKIWNDYCIGWNRNAICSANDNDELVVGCMVCHNDEDDALENDHFLHVWNATKETDFVVGTSMLTKKLRSVFQNSFEPGKNEDDNTEEENKSETRQQCIYTCFEDRVFMVHTQLVQNHESLISGIDIKCRTVVSQFHLLSTEGTMVGCTQEYVERKDIPMDMSVIADGPTRRLLIICDKYQATIHSCGREMMATSRISWRKALIGSTVLFSGMSNLGITASPNSGETKENGATEQVAPFVLVESDRLGLTGYGPGARIPPKKKKNKVGNKKQNDKSNGRTYEKIEEEEEEDGDDDDEGRGRGKKKKKKKKRQESTKAKGVKVRMRCGGGR
jgi:hypothetical protein